MIQLSAKYKTIIEFNSCISDIFSYWDLDVQSFNGSLKKKSKTPKLKYFNSLFLLYCFFRYFSLLISEDIDIGCEKMNFFSQLLKIKLL